MSRDVSRYRTMPTTVRRRVRAGALPVALVSLAAITAAPTVPSGAQGTAVSGEAYGHYTNVGLFGGPQRAVGPAPFVSLPPSGSEQAITANETNAAAVYGPANIFAGKWPCEPDNCPASAPPSGPITVSTQGTPGGSVTSSVDITLHPEPVPVGCDKDPPGAKNCTSTGGFGPIPVIQGDELHSTCTANPSGPPTGSVRFVNAEVALNTEESGEPKDVEKVPDNPPPNYERTGEITNVGDRWRLVLNEQIIEPDGSITVNAVHMFLLGAIAVGEQILGHVRCSVTGSPSSTPTPPPPTTVAAPPGAAERARTAASDEGGGNALPFVLVGGALVIAIAVAVLLVRRRSAPHEPPANPPEAAP